jgi:hypothetical protein
MPAAGASTDQMETATNDEQMVERALSGDPEAFGEIERRWERRIFAYRLACSVARKTRATRLRRLSLLRFETCVGFAASRVLPGSIALP